MADRVPNIIVIGAGFAGMKLVQGLKRARANVVVFDRHNYHLFQPLLYQVASAALSPADIAFPVRRAFRGQCNVQVVLGEVERINLDRKTIGVQGVEQDYDYLAIATGSTHSYFGKEKEWSAIAPGLKTIDDAVGIRNRILAAFEEAENELDEASRKAKLTFVIVGGGPTGVELAGALREIAVQDIQKDFRNIDTSTTRVMIVEANDRLIKQFDKKLSERAKRDLEKMGVEVRIGGRVTTLDEKGLCIGDERIDAQTVFWAAGVQASPLGKTLNVELDKAGRVKVKPDLSVPGHPEVFIVGDLAAIVDPKTNMPVPGLAPAAMQMGTHVAHVIQAEIEHGVQPPERRKAFEYWDKGTMATIGKNKAVADIKGLKFGGFLAWLMWGGVHIMFLISFRNKLIVIMTWAWNYLLNARPARLITGGRHPTVHTVRDVTPNSTSVVGNTASCEVAAAPSSEPAAAAAAAG